MLVRRALLQGLAFLTIPLTAASVNPFLQMLRVEPHPFANTHTRQNTETR
jgi:hypothetical protein